MTRVPDWFERYCDFINEMRKIPFKWGVNDCGPAWAGAVVALIRGSENPMGSYMGKYKSAIGAARVMRKDGFSDLKELMSAKLGAEPQHPSTGVIGDIALIRDDSPFGYSLGIVNGERVFFKTENGIGTMGLLECESIFKV